MCSALSPCLQACFLQEVNRVPSPKKMTGVVDDMCFELYNPTTDPPDLEKLLYGMRSLHLCGWTKLYTR